MSHWIDVAAESELFEGAAIGVAAGGRGGALVKREAGQGFPTDNICSHRPARLGEGFLEGPEIECPFHQGRFDIRTGQPTMEPCVEAIQRYPVKIEGGRVWLDMS